jgi:HEAT repeat protein
VQFLSGFEFPARLQSPLLFATLGLALASSPIRSVYADGCFVFKWNKSIDINEPTQKAIIVHDAGREDMLLQVKYEGPLQEFGWLIPVPSLPTVEIGSMEPFYELSQLTQREMAVSRGGFTLGGSGGKGSHDDGVKVVEVKTVGAYEVSILSAQDSGSLDRWLKAHDYNIPEGKAEIIDEYIHKRWYFIAAKIQLDRDVAFNMVTSASPKTSQDTSAARRVLEHQLSTGELHPLLISLDTPRCIFPLKISSITGKPSEISLYVLSADALLEKSAFDQALAQLHQRRLEWAQTREQNKAARANNGRTSMRNHQALRLAFQMYSMNPGRGSHDWTSQDLIAMSEEGLPPVPSESLEDSFYALPHELLQCFQIDSGKMPKSVKSLPRLKARSWFLTKFVHTFSPEMMRDLEFEPAIPIVSQSLSSPEGSIPAGLLSQLGSNAVPFLVSASSSTNPVERINVSSALGWPADQRYIEPIRRLLKDDVPLVRLHAINAAVRTWDASFAEPLKSLLHDENTEIRSTAAIYLRFHVTEQDRPEYLALLRDPNPDLQSSALLILSFTNSGTIPRADLVRLLGNPRLQTVSLALNILDPGQWPNSPGTAAFGQPNTAREQKTSLSSEEAAPLTTNSITMARLMGLRILQQNADPVAVELALPCLRDTNSIVRNRAAGFLHDVSGEDIPRDQPEKWEQWWAANKATFAARRSTR